MCPSVCSFHDDVPKDYRQVSLTAVKQRFEDKRYQEISQEEVPPPTLSPGWGGNKPLPAPWGLFSPSDPGFLSGAELQPGVRSSRSETREPGTHVFPQLRGPSHLP